MQEPLTEILDGVDRLFQGNFAQSRRQNRAQVPTQVRADARYVRFATTSLGCACGGITDICMLYVCVSKKKVEVLGGYLQLQESCCRSRIDCSSFL